VAGTKYPSVAVKALMVGTYGGHWLAPTMIYFAKPKRKMHVMAVFLAVVAVVFILTVILLS
jgi:hypothetical protein